MHLFLNCNNGSSFQPSNYGHVHVVSLLLLRLAADTTVRFAAHPGADGYGLRNAACAGGIVNYINLAGAPQDHGTGFSYLLSPLSSKKSGRERIPGRS
jgi:hypothetical protein